MNINVPQQVLEIVSTFQKSGYEIFLVGGAIRDIMMSKQVYDWDFTTNAKPQEILKLFKDSFYDNKFGTVGVPSNVEGERPYEITTYRTEYGFSDSRRPDKVEWGKSLEDDLSRRDFTINAMALKLMQPGKSIVDRGKPENNTLNTTNNLVSTEAELVDLYNGQKDLENKFIRTVGNPIDRFNEDALRMMRAIRIASEIGFSIEKSTLAAIKSKAALINKISKERIHDELIKILASKFPYDGLLLMKNSGLMDYILPELIKTFGVEQKSPGRHHVYDVGTHSLMSLKYVTERNSDPIVRLATLIHDIGKPQTYRVLESGTITFYNHEMVSAKIARNIASRLKFSKQDSEKLYTLVRWHQFSVDERQTDSAIRRFIRKVGKENINDMIDLRVGDRLGGGARETSWRLEEYKRRIIEVQKQPFSVQDLKISGHDIMKIMDIKPGPEVGKILNNLFDKVINKKIENKYDELIKSLDQQK